MPRLSLEVDTVISYIPLATAKQVAADRNVDMTFLRGSRKAARLPKELMQWCCWLIPLGALRSRREAMRTKRGQHDSAV